MFDYKLYNIIISLSTPFSKSHQRLDKKCIMFVRSMENVQKWHILCFWLLFDLKRGDRYTIVVKI